jgi:hypothetical protein
MVGIWEVSRLWWRIGEEILDADLSSNSGSGNVPGSAWNRVSASRRARRPRRAGHCGAVAGGATEGAAPVRHSIEERMRYFKVPGLSVAVVEGGHMVWARGSGDAPVLGAKDEMVFAAPNELISLDRGDRFTMVTGKGGRATALVFEDIEHATPFGLGLAARGGAARSPESTTLPPTSQMTTIRNRRARCGNCRFCLRTYPKKSSRQ